eukprot:CAMPEP_0185581052 /NCGR_PEP_ID=MMETSP0434-20130131/18071_1 /TAXON_ID=626734 ORGANISM="Favella taraikaensis, Strain Fe Narragansett Bay" /NCGR_SAMPLE_ID=MMETSP0434 /ASSEMBLY_ACC=CAM_ASM_000379 /LENGTH=79 /DNA_ID=CAMNT_0028199491 /DNA_START=758 /DNA_END=997 /DNA_ORIENTATION=+
MARFNCDERGFYKYQIMSTLYHYAECHSAKQVGDDPQDSLVNPARKKAYNLAVVEYLRSAALSKERVFTGRYELDSLVA